MNHQGYTTTKEIDEHAETTYFALSLFDFLRFFNLFDLSLLSFNLFLNLHFFPHLFQSFEFLVQPSFFVGGFGDGGGGGRRRRSRCGSNCWRQLVLFDEVGVDHQLRVQVDVG